jgi:hypothetical protein
MDSLSFYEVEFLVAGGKDGLDGEALLEERFIAGIS